MGFRLFGRRREPKPLPEHQQKTAGKIAQQILAVQSRWAAKLNAQAQKLGKRNTLIILGALVICFAAYLIYIMVNAIF